MVGGAAISIVFDSVEVELRLGLFNTSELKQFELAATVLTDLHRVDQVFALRNDPHTRLSSHLCTTTFVVMVPRHNVKRLELLLVDQRSRKVCGHLLLTLVELVLRQGF